MIIDIIKRWCVSLFSWLVIAYMAWMMYVGVVVVHPEYSGMNTLASLGTILIAWYVMVVYGLYPLYHPMQKRLLLVLWLICLTLGQMIFINDVDSAIYTGDIVKLFGVLVIWFGATGLMTQNKSIESQKRSKSLEIIEA